MSANCFAELPVAILVESTMDVTLPAFVKGFLNCTTRDYRDTHVRFQREDVRETVDEVIAIAATFAICRNLFFHELPQNFKIVHYITLP